MTDDIPGTYCFLIYSSTLGSDNQHSYEFGFGTSFFRLVGDRPFGRGDVAKIVDTDHWMANEFRINVRVLGDPRISGRHFDEANRVELPTLLFLSSRIYLSEFSNYQITDTINTRTLSFQAVQQERNKIYAVACLAYGAEAKIICKEQNTGNRFEWILSDRSESERA